MSFCQRGARPLPSGTQSTPRSSLRVEGLSRSVPAGRSEVGGPPALPGQPPLRGGAGEVSSSPRYRAKGRETGRWELLGCRALLAESSPVFSPLAGCDKQVHFFVSSFPSVTFRVTRGKSCVVNSACCSGSRTYRAGGAERNTCEFEGTTDAPR